MRRRLPIISLIIFLFYSALAHTAPSAQIPKDLHDWMPWVLRAHPDHNCPLGAQGVRHCAFSSPWIFALNDSGGTFQTRASLTRDGWQALPGNARAWPQSVTVDGQPVVVVSRNQRPSVFLSSGSAEISGRFDWTKIPEQLALPENAGLITLSLNGHPVDNPSLVKPGLLQITRQAKTAITQHDTLRLQVFRRLEDGNPLQITTQLTLEVAGRARQITLPALLPGSTPLALTATLPAEFTPDNHLRIQLRPGRHNITIRARQDGRITTLSRGAASAPWPAQELWAFSANSALRQVKLGGLAQIDASQTNLPRDWHNLPSYLALADETLVLQEVPHTTQQSVPNDLRLSRQLWFDYDGQGATFLDEIYGTMHHTWRLDLDADWSLGRVSVDGTPRLVTKALNSDKAGVELRQSQLNITAAGRAPSTLDTLPASNWSETFKSAQTRLHLPPGYRLWFAKGIDQPKQSNAWVYQWTLFDLFIVSLVCIGFWHLFGLTATVAAALALGLSWLEPESPRFLWINVLAAAALVKAWPSSKWAQLRLTYLRLSVFALLCICLPFCLSQIRLALYPSLEADNMHPAMSAPSITMAELAVEDLDQAPMAKRNDKLKSYLSAPAPTAYVQAQQLTQTQTDALVQTGPGTPNWRIHDHTLIWNNPVQGQEYAQLWVSPPTVTRSVRIICLLSLLFLLLLLFRNCQGSLKKSGSKDAPAPQPQTAAMSLALLSVLCFSMLSTPPAYADYPSPTLLNELQAQLLKPPECAPQCSDIATITVDTDASQLALTLQVHVQAASAVALPGALGQWSPAAVQVGQNDAQLSRNAQGHLLLHLSAGVHNVSLLGPLNDAQSLFFPQRPRHIQLGSNTNWSLWNVDGLVNKRLDGDSLRLQRIQSKPSNQPPVRPIPGFVQVTRHLRLGLDWHVHTHIQRLSATNQAIFLRLPLLPGESVLGQGVRIDADRVLLTLTGNDMHYQSRLQNAQQLILQAADDPQFTERWQLQVDPIYHPTLAGIPSINTPEQNTWQPTWQPFAGETLSIDILRPEAIPGATLTIDSSHRYIEVGARNADVRLDLDLRSSQGGEHIIRLPKNAQLQSVLWDNKPLTLSLSDTQALELPLHPGQQNYQISWTEPRGIQMAYQSAAVDLGVPSSNADTQLNIANSRWILYTQGEGLKPVVLFWGIFLLWLLIALVLSYKRLTLLTPTSLFILAIGLSSAWLPSALTLCVWLVTIRWRTMLHSDNKWLFNFTQLSYLVLTIAAAGALVSITASGLLSAPNMLISGNHSYAGHLNWSLDRTDSLLPHVWVYSAPILAYHLLMLAFALWLAFNALRWLRQAWVAWKTGGTWRPLRTANTQPSTTSDDGDAAT